jgi:hypothetical protein
MPYRVSKQMPYHVSKQMPYLVSLKQMPHHVSLIVNTHKAVFNETRSVVDSS